MILFPQDLFVGEEAAANRSILDIKYPMENGIVKDWDDMCHLWDYTFGPEKMNVDTANSKIMLTEPPMNPMSNRERMIEVCGFWTYFLKHFSKTFFYHFFIKCFLNLHPGSV